MSSENCNRWRTVKQKEKQVNDKMDKCVVLAIIEKTFNCVEWHYFKYK